MLLPLALLALAQTPAAAPAAPPAVAAKPDDAAEAAFRALEPRLAAYRALSLGNPEAWNADFAAKSKALDALKLSYFEVIDRGVPRWIVASLVRVGELQWAMADALEFSPPPAAVTAVGADAVKAYREEMAEQVGLFRDRARASWTRAVAAAKAAAVQSPELEAVRARLGTETRK
jgi:hypothetical protein